MTLSPSIQSIKQATKTAKIYGLTQSLRHIVSRQRETAKQEIATTRSQQITQAIALLVETAKVPQPSRWWVVDATICLAFHDVMDADRLLDIAKDFDPAALPRPLRRDAEWHVSTFVGDKLTAFGFSRPLGRKLEIWPEYKVTTKLILDAEPSNERERQIERAIFKLLEVAKIESARASIFGSTICITTTEKFGAEYLLAIAESFDPAKFPEPEKPEKGWQIRSLLEDEDGETSVCGEPVTIGQPSLNWWNLPPWKQQ